MKRFSGSPGFYVNNTSGSLNAEKNRKTTKENFKKAKYGPLIEKLIEYILEGYSPDEARKKTKEQYPNITDKHVKIAIEEAEKRKFTLEI